MWTNNKLLPIYIACLPGTTLAVGGRTGIVLVTGFASDERLIAVSSLCSVFSSSWRGLGREDRRRRPQNATITEVMAVNVDIKRWFFRSCPLTVSCPMAYTKRVIPTIQEMDAKMASPLIMIRRGDVKVYPAGRVGGTTTVAT